MTEADNTSTRRGNGFKDRTGERYGRLVAIKEVEKRTFPNGKSYPQWLLACDCGNSVVLPTTTLTCGNTKSCGCIKREQSRQMMIDMHYKHGEGKTYQHTPEYRTWRQMKSRCNNVGCKEYKYYGGRGITVCPDWNEDYTKFLSHVGRRPTPLHSIDRIDNSKGYFPGNVRWATSKEQGRNKRNNVLITFRGKTQCVMAWAEDTGMNHGTIRARIKRGLPVSEIFKQ